MKKVITFTDLCLFPVRATLKLKKRVKEALNQKVSPLKSVLKWSLVSISAKKKKKKNFEIFENFSKFFGGIMEKKIFFFFFWYTGSKCSETCKNAKKKIWVFARVRAC